MPSALTHGEGIFSFLFTILWELLKSLIKPEKNELDMILMLFLHSLCIPLVGRVIASLGHNAVHSESAQKSFPFLGSFVSNSSFKLLGINVNWHCDM